MVWCTMHLPRAEHAWWRSLGRALLLGPFKSRAGELDGRSVSFTRFSHSALGGVTDWKGSLQCATLVDSVGDPFVFSKTQGVCTYGLAVINKADKGPSRSHPGPSSSTEWLDRDLASTRFGWDSLKTELFYVVPSVFRPSGWAE